jgi:eukaryotic-like serine/threonine-protein kinase
LQPGTVIAGRYELIQPVGEGGMATVWRGVSRATEHFTRQVAIKVMKASFAPVPHALEMFLEEARIGAELQHAHVIQVLDFVTETHGKHVAYYLVMEWIEGCDLRSLLRAMARLERPVPWRLVAHVGVGVLRGLAAAHERRLADGTPAPVIHRDISPQNILLGLNGAIKLADFGFARARDRSSKATAPGMVKGTVSYMAPETLHGRPATPQTDLYSLACTLWEALAGERLFDGATDIDVIKKIRAGSTRPLDELRPDVPPRLAAALHGALALDPAARPASARAMVQELGEIMRELPPWTDADVIVGTTVAQARDAVAPAK